MFSEKPFLVCIRKEDATFAAGFVALLACYRELDSSFVRYYTLSRNYNGMVRNILVWGPS
jgi:hypothetical protein